MVVPDEFSITWALFADLEMACEHRELPDPEVDALVAGAEDTIGTEGLLSGWALVAAYLQALLLEHADDCDCGTEEWLRRVQLDNAGGVRGAAE